MHVYVDIWGISRFHNGDNLHGAMGPGYGTSPWRRSHEANDKTAEIQLGKYGKPWEKHIKHGKIWKTVENMERIWLVVDLPPWKILVKWDYYSQYMRNMRVKWDYDIPNWMESHNPAMFQSAPTRYGLTESRDWRRQVGQVVTMMLKPSLWFFVAAIFDVQKGINISVQICKNSLQLPIPSTNSSCVAGCLITCCRKPCRSEVSQSSGASH